MIRRISLRAALLDDRDVGGRVADDLVDRRREDRRARAVAAGRRLAAPAEDDQVRLLLGGRLDDPLGGVAADPDDRVDRRALGREVEDALEEPAGVAGARRALADSGMPSGTSTMPSAVSSPARGSSRSAPSRISSSAVAGFATGMRIRAGSGVRPLTPAPRPLRRRGRRSASARRGTASAARTRGPGARRGPRPARSYGRGSR